MPKNSTKKPLILLKHKRGRRIYSIQLCVLCEIHKEQTFYYTDSNWGPVYVCAMCKGELFHRSFYEAGESSDIWMNKSKDKHDSGRSPTPQEATEKLEAIRNIDMIRNKDIKKYLENNPHKEELGKFGVPQDKFRFNFYGSKTMEYDIWRKGEKK